MPRIFKACPFYPLFPYTGLRLHVRLISAFSKGERREICCFFQKCELCHKLRPKGQFC